VVSHVIFCHRYGAGAFSSLQRRARSASPIGRSLKRSRATNKWIRSENGADGVVAHKRSFVSAFTRPSWDIASIAYKIPRLRSSRSCSINSSRYSAVTGTVSVVPRRRRHCSPARVTSSATVPSSVSITSTVWFVTTLLPSAWPVHSRASPCTATQHLLLSAEAARALILGRTALDRERVGYAQGIRHCFVRHHAIKASCEKMPKIRTN